MIGRGSATWCATWVLAAGLCGCTPSDVSTEEPPAEDETASSARWAREIPIVDTHIDTPYRLWLQREERASYDDISQRTDGGDFDFPRAVAGGLDVPFMSIYIPASYQDGGAKEFADDLIDLTVSIAEAHPDKFTVVTESADAEAIFGSGRVGFALGMENGAPIEGDLDNLRYFHQRGIRYITLTHAKNNHICDSSYDDERHWNGLSPFGYELVREMNRLGIMVDISHVSDKAFEQVMETTQAPVIASHSSCRHFTPGFERNMSDAMIRKVAEGGGVIQINFGSSFISDRYRQAEVNYREGIAAHLQDQGWSRDSEEGRAYREAMDAERIKQYADLAEVVDHIDHVVSLVGVDHVGLGSDYDGVGDSLPTGLKDVSTFPNLIEALRERGYDRESIEKICGANLMRVWREVERIAAAAG